MTTFDPSQVNVRVKISALWTSMLFVFVYVDLFSLYRADVRADIGAGRISGFTIGQPFLFGTLAYVAVPSLMVFLTLVVSPRAARATNLVLAAGYAVTIIVSAIGEWGYYVLGSAVEVALLAAVVHYVLTWPRTASAAPAAPRSAVQR